jgi:hypothetical protein
MVFNTPPPPPSHTLSVYTVQHIDFGKRGGSEPEREGYRGSSSQSWVENTNMTDCISNL